MISLENRPMTFIYVYKYFLIVFTTPTDIMKSSVDHYSHFKKLPWLDCL